MAALLGVDKVLEVLLNHGVNEQNNSKPLAFVEKSLLIPYIH